MCYFHPECIMIYKINEHLRYDPQSATLYSPEHYENTLTLSRVNNSMLLLFITHNNQLLSREYLLKELWENQGLDSSNNNLNNNLSILRKSLTICGCEDVIKTVPKKGLIFSAHTIDILPREIKNNKHADKKDIQERISSLRIRTKKPHLMWYLLFIVLIIVIVGFPDFYAKWKLDTFRTEIFRLEKCRIYVTDSETKLLSTNDIRKRIEVFVKNTGNDCHILKANIYLFNREYRDAIGRELATQLISYCPYNSSAPCINYREYSSK
ncbi:winged helix-turn-helix domain-containing protein [Enterobacter kobei]|uniref:winged helix-turn-helix domain-containing protein n=2 Tax=Enterobacter TaxID=547 RepID=UPI0030EB2D8D